VQKGIGKLSKEVDKANKQIVTQNKQLKELIVKVVWVSLVVIACSSGRRARYAWISF
jgi:ribosomal protein S5